MKKQVGILNSIFEVFDHHEANFLVLFYFYYFIYIFLQVATPPGDEIWAQKCHELDFQVYFL